MSKKLVILTIVLAFAAVGLGYVAAGPSNIGMRGQVIAELRGPDGQLKQREVNHNIVTMQGDSFAAAAIYTAAYSTWGMKLSDVNVAPVKSGEASYIGDGYITGSAKALDDSTPKAGTDPNIVQFRRLYAAGEGTSTTIYRVSIVNNTTDSNETDATGTYAISRFNQVIDKGADDTLTITWNVTYEGS